MLSPNTIISVLYQKHAECSKRSSLSTSGVYKQFKIQLLRLELQWKQSIYYLQTKKLELLTQSKMCHQKRKKKSSTHGSTNLLKTSTLDSTLTSVKLFFFLNVQQKIIWRCLPEEKTKKM